MFVLQSVVIKTGLFLCTHCKGNKNVGWLFQESVAFGMFCLICVSQEMQVGWLDNNDCFLEFSLWHNLCTTEMSAGECVKGLFFINY